MLKQNIYRSLIIGALLTTALNQSWAQAIKTAVSDSVARKEVPGALFKTKVQLSTGAVSTVSGEILQKTRVPNLFNTLTGNLSGLTMVHGNGDPGNDDARYAIRGAGTTALGRYNTCKIYVDGFEVHSNYLSYLSDNEIESISVLKDAAALAPFGMSGANGVLWVVTKKGEGKIKINFQGSYGIQRAININKPLNSFDFANLYNQAISNDNGNVWTPKYSPDELENYRNGTGTNVDWYDEVLKKNGAYANGNLTFSGSVPNLNYFVALTYGNQQGLLNSRNTDSTSNAQFAHYSVRSNLEFKMFKVVEARVGLYARLEDRKFPNQSSNNTSAIFSQLESYPSNIYPVYDGNTSHFSGTGIYPNNPYASIMATGWKSSRRRYLQGNFGLREHLDFITPGLYLDESVSFMSYASTMYNKTRNYERYFNGSKTTNDQLSSLTASAMQPYGQDDWKQGKILLGYNRQFGNHGIQSAFEYHISSETGEGNYSYQVHTQNISGRANYSYKNRYIGEVGFSYFGYDGYRPGNQWGFYPTVSGAWVVSNEDFMQGNAFINYLKLRASVGKSGNYDATVGNGISNFSTNGRYLYQQYYVNSGSFYTGTTSPTNSSGMVKLFSANPDIFAEQSMKYNVGLEFTLFQKLQIGVDAYLDKRTDIPVIDNTIPSFYAEDTKINNLGKMTNKGVDLNLSFTDTYGSFAYTLMGMASYNKNKIDNMSEIPTAFSYNAYTGRAYGTPVGLVADGFYQLDDFNTDGTLKSGLPKPMFGDVQPGDMKYKDLDGDTKVDQTDVTSIGKTDLPEWTYSFGGNVAFKGFDLSILFQGTAGSSVNILNAANAQVEAFTNNSNAYAIAKGAWAYYPEQGIDTRNSATYPRLTTKSNTNNYRASSFWMKNNDYLRIRNVELGYTLKQSWQKKCVLSNFRIYVNAVNPLTWSSLLKDYNIDPETFSGYPALQSFNIGFSATF